MVIASQQSVHLFNRKPDEEMVNISRWLYSESLRGRAWGLAAAVINGPEDVKLLLASRALLLPRTARAAVLELSDELGERIGKPGIKGW